MDMDGIVAFVAVADAASFSAAGRTLGLPVSTVSRRVAALEAALGVQLLHRTTRRVSLSTSGTALRERVAPLLASLRAAVTQLPGREEEPAGELRVTAPIDIGAFFVADIVARFVTRHPLIRVDLHLTNERVDLVGEGFDVALRVALGRLGDSSLMARKATHVSGGLFAAPTYLARRGVPRTPADLDDHEWVTYRDMGKVRLEGGGEPTQVTPRGRVQCDDMLFMREALRAGAGIGWLPVFLPQAELASGQLTRVLPRWQTRSGHLWVLWPATRHLPPSVAAFRDFVVASLLRAPLA